MATVDFLSVFSRRAILVAGFALIAVILGGTALSVLLLREAAFDRAEENLSNLATVLAEQTHRTILAVDLVVAATVADASAHFGGALSEKALHERLRDRAAALPEVEGLAVLDRAGALANHSRRFPPPAANYADREYFAPHRDRRVEGLYVGAPIVGRLVPGWQQTFTRRIEDRHGQFLGIASAAVKVDRLHAFYRTLRLGTGGRVTIFRTDGVLLNTYPLADSEMGRSLADDRLFTDLARAGSGFVNRAGFIDREPRLIAYERLRDYPVVVAISSTERHALADWRDGAATLAIVAGGASLLIGLGMLLALRQREEGLALRDELGVSADRLNGIIQSVMDAVITVDENENIVLFNAAAERIFGCSAGEAVGGPLERFIPERYRAAHHGHIRRFAELGTTTRMMGPRLVLSGLRAGGQEFPIDASISQVTVGGHQLFTVILRDVTETRRAEDALQRSFHERRAATERLHGIIQSAMDAIITIDRGQRIVVFNEAAERIFRCRSEQAMGSPIERFIPERFRAAHRGHVERFGETRVTTRAMGARLELYGLRADGEEFPIDASISQVTVDGEKFYTVILRDVSGRKAAEEALRSSYDELREMSAVMNEVREAERTRIARELHDELAQWLTAVKMDVSWLAARLPREEDHLVQRTEKMKQLVDTTVMAVRRIAADLRPVMLDDLGLVASIEHLLHTFSERSGIAVSFEAPAEDVPAVDALVTGIYRIVQEALTNVARHAQATEVSIRVGLEDDTLRVEIRDNGRGLGPVESQGKSFGLLGIRERAQTLGGSAAIHSPAGGGTIVGISIPLARYREREGAK